MQGIFVLFAEILIEMCRKTDPITIGSFSSSVKVSHHIQITLRKMFVLGLDLLYRASFFLNILP